LIFLRELGRGLLLMARIILLQFEWGDDILVGKRVIFL